MARLIQKRERKSLILIKTEGTKSAEKIYFNNFNSRNSRIKFATGNSTDVSGMLDDLINYMEMNDISVRYGDKIFFVIDTDLDDKRICDIKKVQKNVLAMELKLLLLLLLLKYGI